MNFSPTDRIFAHPPVLPDYTRTRATPYSPALTCLHLAAAVLWRGTRRQRAGGHAGGGALRKGPRQTQPRRRAGDFIVAHSDAGQHDVGCP